MSFVLYGVTAAAILFLAHRFVAPLGARAALILALLPLVMTGRAMLTGRVIAPIEMAYLTEPLYGLKNAYGVGGVHNASLSDVAFQMIPWRAAVRRALADREWPLLNPSILGGDLLAASAQPAAYNPVTWIACLLPPAESFNVSASVALLLAALAAFVFAVELGCGEAAAFVAAIGYALSTPVTTFAMWPLGAAWAVFPFVLLATRRCVRAPNVASGATLLVALSLVAVSGHPESLLHIVAFSAAYGLYELWPRRNDTRRVLFTVTTAGVLTLGVCAIDLLPILDALPQTFEHELRQRGFTKDPRRDPLDRIAAGAATDLFPFLEGRTWRSESLQRFRFERMAAGSIVVALALIAIVTVRGRDKRFFAIAFFICAMAGLRAPPVSSALHALPLFNVALNERLVFAAAFSLAMLAALALGSAARMPPPRVALVAAFLAIAIGTVVLARFVTSETPSWTTFRVVGELAPLAAIALLPRRASLIAGALFVQRALDQSLLYPANDARAAYPPLAILAPLANVREPFRIVGRGMTLIPNAATLYGLEDARGYQAVTFKPLTETYPLWCERLGPWFNRVDDLTRPFLAMMNVRFAITKASDAIPNGWREVAVDRTGRVIENPAALPRAFIPRHVRINAPNELDEMSRETDFAERSYIRAVAERAQEPAQERANGPGTILSLRRRKNDWNLDADMQRDGWIVVTQTAWNGWRAYVDGGRVRHQIANHAFIGVFLPAGRHSVRLTFLPESFVIGRATTFATLVAIVVFAFIRRRRSV